MPHFSCLSFISPAYFPYRRTGTILSKFSGEGTLFCRCVAFLMGILFCSAHQRGYSGMQLVRLSCSTGSETLGDSVQAAIEKHWPNELRAWGEGHPTQIGYHSGMIAEVIISPEQQQALSSLVGLKVAVLVEDLQTFLNHLQRRELLLEDNTDELPGKGAPQATPVSDSTASTQTGEAFHSKERPLGRKLIRDLSWCETGANPTCDWFLQYHNYVEVVGRCNEMGRSFPELVSVSRLPGTVTHEGREVTLIRLRADNHPQILPAGRVVGEEYPESRPADPAVRLTPRPRVVLLGNQHAREWISAMVPMLVAEELVRGYGVDEEVTELLDSVEVVIIPVLNPDGYEFTRAPDGSACTSHLTEKLQCDRLWRKNRSPSSSTGPHTGPAGECLGVDLNRNYPVDWGPRGGESISESLCSDQYIGPHAFSEPESAGLKRLLEGEQFTALVDLHSYSQLVLAPWAHQSTPPPHARQLDKVGRDVAAAMRGLVNADFEYTRGDANGDLYFSSGILTDWAYGEMGLLSFSIELRPLSFNPGFLLGPEYIRLSGQEVLAGFKALAKHLYSGDWKEEGSEVAVCEDGVIASTLEVIHQPDRYPAETAWHLMDERNRTLMSDENAPGVYTLCDPGRFTFFVTDAFGDGMCCDHGYGSLSLVLNGNTIWQLPRDFKSTAQFRFSANAVFVDVIMNTNHHPITTHEHESGQVSEFPRPSPGSGGGRPSSVVVVVVAVLGMIVVSVGAALALRFRQNQIKLEAKLKEARRRVVSAEHSVKKSRPPPPRSSQIKESPPSNAWTESDAEVIELDSYKPGEWETALEKVVIVNQENEETLTPVEAIVENSHHNKPSTPLINRNQMLAMICRNHRETVLPPISKAANPKNPTEKSSMWVFTNSSSNLRLPLRKTLDEDPNKSESHLSAYSIDKDDWIADYDDDF